MNKITLFKILLYLALTAVTILAFLPSYNALPAFLSFSDLLNHTIAFIILYLLLAGAYPLLGWKNFIFLLLFYASWIEGVQYLLPTRYASWGDIAADSVGLLLGYLIMRITKRFSKI